MILLGLDPGLNRTGWGVILADGNRLSGIANGVIATAARTPLPERLMEISAELDAVIGRHRPDAAAVEETFVNRNAQSTLRLGAARGVVLLAPARSGLAVSEYAAPLVKKTVTGSGHADKAQVRAMVSHLLPGQTIESSDAADALAVAICHAHHLATQNAMARSAVVMAGAGS